ncbi:MAG: PAS domain S-box protein [Alphaproteobacteria bacterium]|nr:PAS domain S-box protein [Alphaproteobacteria bacterium]
MRAFLELDSEDPMAPGLRIAITLAGLLVLCLAAVVGISLAREREYELAEVSRLADRSAASFAETLGHGLDKADLVLQTLAAGLGHAWPASGKPQDLFGVGIFDWLAYAPQMNAIRVYDAAGTAEDGSSLDPTLLSLHLEGHAYRLSAVSRESGGGIRLSRRIVDAGGRMMGIVVAEMPARSFDELVVPAAAPEVMCAALVAADGRVLAHWQRLPGTPICVDAVDHPGEGIRRWTVDRRTAVASPLRGRPLAMLIEADTGIVLARWQDQALRQSAMLAVLILGIVVASVVIMRLIRRQFETSAFLRAFVDNSTTAINMRDGEGRYILANPTFEELLGVKQADLIGRTPDEVFPSEIAEPSNLEFRHVMTTRRPLVIHRGFDSRRGGARHFVFTRFPVFGPGGRIVAVGSVGTDITEVRMATAALRQTEEKFAKVFHESPDAIAIIRSIDSKIVEANEGFGRLIGRPLRELIGQRMIDFEWWADLTDRGRFLAELEQNGVVRDFEFRAKKDGRIMSCVIHAAIIEIDGVMHDVSITRDMTERTESAERLKQANVRLAEQATELEHLAQSYRRQREEAETANRAKTEFLAHMSHELRTPLNAVIGFSEMIQSQLVGPVPPRYVDYAEAIGRAAHHLLTVINDILDVSRIEIGRYELRKDSVDVAGVVADCCRMVAGRAGAAGILVTNHVPVGLPKPWADARAIKQILINLLSNAVKFTSVHGRIAVSAALEGDDLCLTVSDTGTGISAEDLRHVFEPFWHGESRTTRTREGAGTGLGLSICKKLIELHGGRIHIDSEVGFGTRVTIRLPLGVDQIPVIETAAG